MRLSYAISRVTISVLPSRIQKRVPADWSTLSQSKVNLLMLKQLLAIVYLKILKIMPIDAYNASIILKCLATHTYYAQNYASIIYLPLVLGPRIQT